MLTGDIVGRHAVLEIRPHPTRGLSACLTPIDHAFARESLPTDFVDRFGRPYQSGTDR